MMLSSTFIALSILLSPASAAVASLAGIAGKTSTPANTVPGRYIVEMTSVAGLAGKRTYVASPHQDLYEILRRRDIPFEVKNEFDTKDIWVGATLQLSSDDVRSFTRATSSSVANVSLLVGRCPHRRASPGPIHPSRHHCSRTPADRCLHSLRPQ